MPWLLEIVAPLSELLTDFVDVIHRDQHRCLPEVRYSSQQRFSQSMSTSSPFTGSKRPVRVYCEQRLLVTTIACTDAAAEPVVTVKCNEAPTTWRTVFML